MATHKGHEAHCAHALAFCERCEVPYCTKCSYEWAKPCTLSHYFWYNAPHYPSTTYQPSQPFFGSATGGSTLGGSVTVSNATGALAGADHAMHH